jgi:hypothetical protein
VSTLPKNLRRQLENAIQQARKFAEGGARKALEALAVHEPDPYRHMDEAQRDLRRKLRAQARQLGDGESKTRPGAYEIKHLVEKLAYDQWHRLLFARFLLENNLLISPEHGVSVSLDDCEELAPSVGFKDAWAVAAQFAAKELPEIFRADDPAGAVELAPEDRKPLIQLVTGLPVEVFTASDSLGWCYQFWQTERKDEVNAAGKKIGADELPAVTQLFTEDYMVDFLLDNTLGAWHAGKVLGAKPAMAEAAQNEDELRNAATLPGCLWKYLRFIKAKNGKWTPAAGTFDGWPQTTKEFKCLDPCMGSGHFVVAMFERLVAVRMAEENLNEAAAVPEVIRDNLFGLEIDPRCTQIGAFNLALAAWRRVGHCKLPAMNIACCGLAPNAREADWLAIAGNNEKLRNGMERLYRLFKDAPLLGSLINPRAAEGDLLEAAFHQLQPLLEKALAQESRDDMAHEMTVTAHGVAKAGKILASQFTLVATNVPYLGRRKQDDFLKDYCERVYPDAKADLATCFIERCLEFCLQGGAAALVTPQSWLFLRTYKKLRERLLSESEFDIIVRLGPNAFQDMNWWAATTAMFSLGRRQCFEEHLFTGLDVAHVHEPQDKAQELVMRRAAVLNQTAQLSNPDATIVFEPASGVSLLSEYADSIQGASTLDIERFRFNFWEVTVGDEWVPHQTSPSEGAMFSGMEYVSIHRNKGGRFEKLAAELKAENRLGGAWSGQPVWGKIGISCAWMGTLPTAIYLGTVYDNSIAAIIPKNHRDLPAVWCFCSSPLFFQEVRKINQKSQVANATLVKVPFDLTRWQKVAAEKYPQGLPKPFSSDPTQWLFNGHPKGSDQPLHVAVARLLGYQWPRQTGSSFPDCPAPGPDGLERWADADGIVCLSASKGEAPAAERLRILLLQALGKFDLRALIASAGPKGGEAGSDARLQATKELQSRLKLILEGEPPYDIFVRWKPLGSQAIGWHPDINDGVRINIRPFLVQGIPGGKKGAGILRTRPNIKWQKDRGKEPVRGKKEFPWFWGWDEEKQDFAGIGDEPDGNRWNDCHYTSEFKLKAQAR